MSVDGALLGISVLLDAVVLCLVWLRRRRTWNSAPFTALSLAFILAGATSAWGSLGGPPIAAVGYANLWMLALAHPLAAICCLGALHGPHLLRNHRVILLLLAPVPLLPVVAYEQRWTSLEALEQYPLAAFLVASLSIALAEAIHLRATSPLLGREAIWIIIALLTMILAGPVYRYQFQALGLPAIDTLSLASPATLGAIALVIEHSEPFPRPPHTRVGRWSGESRILAGLVIVFDEPRPKNLAIALRREERAGRPVLALRRAAMATAVSDLVKIEPSRQAALKTFTTASAFFFDAPGGAVALEGLADLAALCGWEVAFDLVRRLRRQLRATESTLLIATSRLRQTEQDELRLLGPLWWTLPDPADEAEGLISSAFGPAAPRLFASFLATHAVTRATFTADHIPALVAFLHESVRRLTTGVPGLPQSNGLREMAIEVGRALDAFAETSAAELSEGHWPSKAPVEPGQDLLVTAEAYWRGRTMDEATTVRTFSVPRQKLYDRVLSVFEESLGDAGRNVFQSELTRLGRRPADLQASDIRRLADRVAVYFSMMADIVDLPREKWHLQARIERLRQQLSLIAEERS